MKLTIEVHSKTFAEGWKAIALEIEYHVSNRKRKYRISSFIRKLIIRIASYPNWFGPLSKFVENSTKVICLKITGYRIKGTML
jgi:hypothetical protein